MSLPLLDGVLKDYLDCHCFGLLLQITSGIEKTEESEPECFCGLPAKLRVSRTAKNPFRLFHNCPKNIPDQCGFFHWSDEPTPSGDRHIDELDLIRNECIQLQERLAELQLEHNEEKNGWEREKAQLTTQLSAVKGELEDIHNKIKKANESDLMPPIDRVPVQNDEDDGATLVREL